MKCLIIAAENGSQLSRKGNANALIPMMGIPLIERVMRSAIQAGIEEFYVVSDYNGEQVRPFLDRLATRCKVAVTHIINHDLEQDNGVSVLKATKHLSEPFLLLMADHLFDP